MCVRPGGGGGGGGGVAFPYLVLLGTEMYGKIPLSVWVKRKHIDVRYITLSTLRLWGTGM